MRTVPPTESVTPDIEPPSTPPLRPPQQEFRFRSPFAPVRHDPLPLLELRLRWLSATIQEKPRWWEKVRDFIIVSRWTSEIVEYDRTMVDKLWGGEKWYDVGEGEKQWPRERITGAQLGYLFGELEYIASQRDGGIVRTAVPMVYESSVLIPPSLKQSVRELAQRLEDIPDGAKDWHPGSPGQVLDLVHPSMYCLRIGGSFLFDPQPGHTDPLELLSLDRYLRDRPDVAAPCAHRDWLTQDVGHTALDFAVSHSFQWLPTDFAVSEEGHVTPGGYINNLNPTEHRAGYAAIASVVQRFVPLFEHVLSDALSPRPRSPFVIDPYKWYDHLIEPENLLNEDFEETPEGAAWMRAHHWPRLPDALPFQPPPSDECVSLSLRGRTIQVIVKMANIVLTPEKPTYPGGSWHVEGMQNERIVATGLFYYDSANITESRLAFREAVGDGQYTGASALEYEQDDDSGYTLVYGIGRGIPLNQRLGDVVAKEDKCLAFPNVYQHCVAPFELVDHSLPGHRKILALFLVDPFTAIYSTSQVPPQQERWYKDAVFGEGPLFEKLPQEVSDIIMGLVLEGVTVSLDQAKGDREDLMKERGKFMFTHNAQVFEAGFIRKERGEKIFACHLASCPRRFSAPKTRRLHLIQAHGYPKEYFFAVTNKGVGGLLKKWGEGASLLRRPWQRRENGAGDEDDDEEKAEAEMDAETTDTALANAEHDDSSDDDDEILLEKMPLDRHATDPSKTNGTGAAADQSIKSATNGKDKAKGKARQSSEDVDALAGDMDSLSLVPSSIQFGRGAKRGALQSARGRGAFSHNVRAQAPN
ncbi:hypothetical protein C8Q79DRAFT_1013602 [Trametes meyenii]|nr:hypothetical protein C8Q79DRAFT_1013602 [Trametes meyenii]